MHEVERRRPLRKAPALVLVGFWLALHAVLARGLVDMVREGMYGDARSPLSAAASGSITDVLSPILSMALGGYSLMLGGALLAWTWLLLPRDDRRTLPTVVGAWALVTFVALCGGLPFRFPLVLLFVHAGAWVATAEVLRVLLTAALRHWRPEIGHPEAGA
jgi:hypothetical protein